MSARSRARRTQADPINASAAQLRGTFSDVVMGGDQPGAGSADGTAARCNFDAFINQEATPLNRQNSYLRV